MLEHVFKALPGVSHRSSLVDRITKETEQEKQKEQSFI